jgi:hypothetical protein
MDRVTTSNKREEFSENGVGKQLADGLYPYNPDIELLNEDFIAKVLWQCLKDGDVFEYIDTLKFHLKLKEKQNKSKLCKHKKNNDFNESNPTLKDIMDMFQNDKST